MKAIYMIVYIFQKLLYQFKCRVAPSHNNIIFIYLYTERNNVRVIGAIIIIDLIILGYSTVKLMNKNK